jgi:hypothetical protein
LTIFRGLIAAIFSLFAALLTIPLIILGLPFWIVAFLARFIHARASSFRWQVSSWQHLIEYAPTVGWKPKPNLNAYAYADKVFHLTTDAQGWRGKTTLQESDIVVFGDSYAFGYGVSDKSFFAELSDKVKIKAIGVNGYNMVQALLWMRELSAELNGKLVVWFIYFGNDLYDNLQPNMDHYRTPFVRRVNGTGSWEVVTSHVSPVKWSSNAPFDYYEKLAEICSPTLLSERAFSACEFLISSAHDICARAGAQLVVMTVPDIKQIDPSRTEKLAALAPDPAYFDPGLPDRKIAETCGRLGVPFVTLGDHLDAEDHKEYDPHWNEKGHERVAEILYNLYQKKLPEAKEGKAASSNVAVARVDVYS